MSQTLEAVYEDGVIKPLQKVDFPEHTRLQLEITPLTVLTVSLRDLWKGAGHLSDEDVEAAKRLWEDGVEEQRRTLKGASE